MTTTTETSEWDTTIRPGEGSAVDRSHFLQTLKNCVDAVRIDTRSNVLIVGGSYRDANVLYAAGFRQITLSNIEPITDAAQLSMEDAELTILYADAEHLPLADGAYNLVLAHEVLHHCNSPHRALLEMLRVSRKHVILMEPNDSPTMRALIKMRFSFPYELPAVTGNNYEKGGVQNTSIPNYIYRWDRRSVYQTTAAYMPESEFSLHFRQYWDFNVDKEELARRSETRIGSITNILGPRAFLAGLSVLQAIMNRLPRLNRQGNKFFACITKQDALKPWIVRNGDKLDFNRNYKR